MLIALALVGLGSPAVGLAGEPAFDGPLTTRGQDFVDPEGRIVVMHGLMGVWKQEPYIPSGDDDGGAVPTFTEGDADIVEELGFDAMRLAWFWEGLEPADGTYDEDYLDKIAGVESKLAERDIYSVLDSHQDQYNKIFGDKPGFPEWTSPLDVDDTFEGLPVAPDRTDPRYFLWKFPVGYTQPSTARAFGELYADRELPGGRSIQEAYGDAWQKVVTRFKDRPMVAGYDLMNEPWPATTSGSVAQCSTPEGCADWDRQILQPLFNTLATAVREVDTAKPVFYEPTIFFNSGSANHFQAPPAELGPVGLSFHNQCSTRARYSVTNPKDPNLITEGHIICPKEEARVMHNAEDTATRLGGPALMTEVAPTSDDDTQGLNCLLERADYFQTGFTYGLSWSGPNKELRRLDTDSEADGRAPFKRQVLARVYPRAIAGTPERYAFDVRTGRFEMSYVPDRSITAPTAISVPAGIQYPEGFQVQVTGGQVVSDPGAGDLLIEANPGAAKVDVVITAKPDDLARPDFPACVLDPKDPPDPDPEPDPDPDPEPEVGTVRASIKSISPRSLKGFWRKGRLVVTVRCGQKCGVNGALKVNRATALRLKLKVRKPATSKVVATDHATAGSGKTASVVLKLGHQVKKRLRNLRRITMNLEFKVTATGLKSLALKRRITF